MVLSEIHDYFGVSNGNIQTPKKMNKKNRTMGIVCNVDS